MKLFTVANKTLKKFGCCLCKDYENCRSISRYLLNDGLIDFDENINKCKRFAEDMRYFNSTEFNGCDVKEILYIGICV